MDFTIDSSVWPNKQTPVYNMLPLLHNILAGLVGTLTSVVTIMAVQMLSSKMYPIPPHLDFSDKDAVRRVMNQLPIGAYLMLQLSYALGSFNGGYVIAYLATSSIRQLLLALGVFLTFCGVQNLTSIPHPIWLAVLTTVTYIPMVYTGGLASARVHSRVMD